MAVKKIVDDEDQLLAVYDFPAEHWLHLRATDPIERVVGTGIGAGDEAVQGHA
ncbi:hypothetical protein M4J07_000104 [Streptomyces longispororuber]|uniref:hypothetical protein n=1 Tax=Streptomyces longispororuber TaxID=68230 RepID=UPI00210DB101|nr:hypothetical protein [Streptomyces longispororuber]MCQ4205618.1 hypothetical protein [Streptomyces longispororuber]